MDQNLQPRTSRFRSATLPAQLPCVSYYSYAYHLAKGGLGMVISNGLRIRPATENDVPLLLKLIRGLAEYEKLSDSVSATEERLRAALFGTRPYAEAILAYANDKPVAYA